MIILLTPSHKPKEASKSILKKEKKNLSHRQDILAKKNSINPHTKCKGADTTTLYTSTKKKTY
jgi:hypothetical protein